MKTLSITFAAMLALAGCNERWYLRSPFGSEPPTILHPIDQTDIIGIPAGAKVEWDDMEGHPGDLFFIEKPGYFLSDFYISEVMNIEIRKK